MSNLSLGEKLQDRRRKAQTIMATPTKMQKMEPMESKISGAGTGDEGAGGGASHEAPIGVVAHGLSNFSTQGWKITSAGTTWINTTSAGQVGTDWTCFPWEFPQLFMSNNERVDLYNDYLFWKCDSVTVTFKNFRGYVNMTPDSSTTAQTFPTDNAAFQTYRDEMYYLGPQLLPFINETNWMSAADLTTLLRSWQTGGYNVGDRVSLPVFDIPVTGQFENFISQNYPNVTQTLGIPTETVSHTWHTSGDKYWRCTSEFCDGMNDATKDPAGTKVWAAQFRPFRCDQYGGYVLSGSNSMIMERSVFNGTQDSVTANTTAAIPPTCYSTHEPIPPLLLRIVPQHIEGNGNSTHLQFDFEITYNIKVRGKIPRHGYTNDNLLSAAGLNLTGTTQGLNRPGSRTLALPYYPVSSNTAGLPNLLPLNGQNIQRGRLKNGFVFIPYTGWETSVLQTAPSPAPSVANWTALFNRAHVHDGDTGEERDQILLSDPLGTATEVSIPIAEFVLGLQQQNLYLTNTVNPAEWYTHVLPNRYASCKVAIPTTTPSTGAEIRTYGFTSTPLPEVSGAPSVTVTDAATFRHYLDRIMQAHIKG